MRRGLFTLLCLLLSSAPALAQIVVNPTRLTFESADHLSIDSYQAMIFEQSADPAAGVPIVVGPVIPKSTATLVTPITVPPVYQLTVAQAGIVPPPCGVVQANCPIYRALLVAIGPTGTSAKGVAAESNPFTAGSTAVPPAGPWNVKALP